MHGRLTGSQSHIFSRDPAIDRADAQLAAAAEAGIAAFHESGDRAGIPLKNGKQPAVWQFRSLGVRAYLAVTRTTLLEVQKVLPQGLRAIFDMPLFPVRYDAFRHGVVGVEGASDGGRAVTLKQVDEGGSQVLSQESVDEVFRIYGPKLIGEIGQRVLDESELDPT